MLVIKKKDVLLEDTIKIFDKDYKIEIVLEPTSVEMVAGDNPRVWAMETIESMTIVEDKQFYKDIEDSKLETTVLNYLIGELQKKDKAL